jgi:GntR family transcriptional regulator, trigonelline degradation regulator
MARFAAFDSSADKMPPFLPRISMPKTMRNSTSQPKTVIDDCVSRLRSNIMGGNLRPGQKLIEADLCDQMGISRPSLREALRVLEADKLVELVPNRGPSVARLGEQQIEEIHDVWSMLTGEAIYRFAEVAKAKDIANLSRMVAKLKSASRLDNPLEMLDATNELFATMMSKCENNLLVEMVYSLVSRINFLRAQSLLDKEWRHLCIEEIEEMISAIRDNKPTAARHAVRRHISSACKTAKQIMLQSKPAAGERNRLLGRVSELSKSERRRDQAQVVALPKRASR